MFDLLPSAEQRKLNSRSVDFTLTTRLHDKATSKFVIIAKSVSAREIIRFQTKHFKAENLYSIIVRLCILSLAEMGISAQKVRGKRYGTIPCTVLYSIKGNGAVLLNVVPRTAHCGTNQFFFFFTFIGASVWTMDISMSVFFCFVGIPRFVRFVTFFCPFCLFSLA